MFASNARIKCSSQMLSSNVRFKRSHQFCTPSVAVSNIRFVVGFMIQTTMHATQGVVNYLLHKGKLLRCISNVSISSLGAIISVLHDVATIRGLCLHLPESHSLLILGTALRARLGAHCHRNL